MKTITEIIDDEVEHNDYWSEDEFENTVASALIACFETKPKKNRGAAPSDRLNEERIAVIRREGPYIPSNSRVYEFADYGNAPFDIQNDPLPLKGVVATIPKGLPAQSNPNAYLLLSSIKQVNALGKYWHKTKSGVLYEYMNLYAENNGIDGERRFFTVTKDGEVAPCNQRFTNNHGYRPGERAEILTNDETWLRETSVWASMTLQALADKRFCWTITANEKTARAHLGCMQEEIKSLLYARSLPMTATGRKRPILHLVESHRRRIKSGIDIDVSAFLRGERTVEIEGTVFVVNPPQSLKPRLSANSQKSYYEQQPAA